MVEITIDHIRSWSKLDYPIALNSYQFRLLGLGWPPQRGWIGRLIGRSISDELAVALQQLRGLKKRERREVLKSLGTTPARLFHRKLRRIRC